MSAVLSILAASSMPVGKAGAQPASITAGKQSALPAGVEPVASESSASGNDHAETNFQQAFSSALRDSTAPVRGTGKPPSGIVTQPATAVQSTKKTDTETPANGAVIAQTPSNGNQLVAAVNPPGVNALISDMLSSTPPPTSPGDSKTPASTFPLAPKETSTSKSKTVSQSEPADPKAGQASTESQNAALVSSVAGAFANVPAPQATVTVPVLSEAASTDKMPASSIRDLPTAPTPELQKAPAETTAPATNSPAQGAQSTPDSLSFALLLHPKLAQGPITSTQSIPVVKQAPESRSSAPAQATLAVDQTKTGADNDPKAPVAPVLAGNSIQPVQAAESARTQLAASDPAQAQKAVQSATVSSVQQSANSSSTVSQTHSSQDQLPSDPPQRGKAEPASDSNSATVSGLSDIAKPVIAATNVIPNATGAPVKAAEPVSGTPVPAQILNAQNQTPAAAAKEVVVRLQGQSGEAISVRLVDQGGQVQVAVRSSDPATANLLRQDLSSLTNNLDRAGWKPEVLSSTPAAASFVRETSQGSPNDGQNSQGQGQGTLDWNQQDSSRRRSTVADLWDEILTRQGT